MGSKAEDHNRPRPFSDATVRALNRPGRHADAGCKGLYLQVAPRGTKSWLYRFALNGRRREMGLGDYPAIGLAAARSAALDARRLFLRGIDPIDARKADREAKRAKSAATTFEAQARAYIAAQAKGWRNERQARLWTASLEAHVFPKLGAIPVADIETRHVLAALEPIWSELPETASRLRGRIERILDAARARGLRSGENPARWRGHLDHLLAKRSKVRAVVHHRAMPWAELPAFMARLRGVGGMGARALEFAILTAARSGEVRGATWSEFDLEAGEWVVPAERMKAGRAHRVPLSPAALELLRALPRMVGSEYVFPAAGGGKQSDMTLSAVTRRMGVDAVPHGFRASFRNWAAEATAYPREVAEAALAHTLADRTEAAYMRSDLFERRRALMADWAAYCATR